MVETGENPRSGETTNPHYVRGLTNIASQEFYDRFPNFPRFPRISQDFPKSFPRISEGCPEVVLISEGCPKAVWRLSKRWAMGPSRIRNYINNLTFNQNLKIRQNEINNLANIRIDNRLWREYSHKNPYSDPTFGVFVKNVLFGTSQNIVQKQNNSKRLQD